MNKFRNITLALLFLIAGNAVAQTVKLTANDVKIKSNGTADFTVSLETSMIIKGWGFKLYLPSGIDIAYNDEEYVIALSDRYTSSKKQFAANAQPSRSKDGTYYLFNCYAKNGAMIADKSGEILTITLTASKSFSGTKSLTFKDINVADAESNQIDQNGEVTVAIGENITSGIKTINAAEEDAPVYNINGQRVENPKSGVYVRQGRKVVVR